VGERGEREEEREREGGEKHLQQREELSAGQKLEDHVEALRVLVRGDEARAEGVVAPAAQGGRVRGRGRGHTTVRRAPRRVGGYTARRGARRKEEGGEGGVAPAGGYRRGKEGVVAALGHDPFLIHDVLLLVESDDLLLRDDLERVGVARRRVLDELDLAKRAGAEDLELDQVARLDGDGGPLHHVGHRTHARLERDLRDGGEG